VGKSYTWDENKNQKLVRERKISFEAIVSYIESGAIVAVIPGRGKFAHQKQFLVAVNNYIYIVPCVEKENEYFLKTIIPSRKMTRLYLSGGI
jgi:hypothetical protein